jgi:hypothetical protein
MRKAEHAVQASDLGEDFKALVGYKNPLNYRTLNLCVSVMIIGTGGAAERSGGGRWCIYCKTGVSAQLVD